MKHPITWSQFQGGKRFECICKVSLGEEEGDLLYKEALKKREKENRYPVFIPRGCLEM